MLCFNSYFLFFIYNVHSELFNFIHYYSKTIKTPVWSSRCIFSSCSPSYSMLCTGYNLDKLVPYGCTTHLRGRLHEEHGCRSLNQKLILGLSKSKTTCKPKNDLIEEQR
ncbi:hypothetical protein ZIOFF_004872 [Zingiber officinale]|uniref:Uncharacterized protein n=1 Tax=Zingiber officinale TaxID=94328 RepID=A0A8J5M154_ZINOF|nr:hypothetical protein ZIOFF_004872 [Zingiber officinale]